MKIFLTVIIFCLAIVVVGLLMQLRRLRMRQHEMEAQSRAKDEILSLIGHNLRGPLTVTEGLEAIIDEYIRDGDLDEIRGTFHELEDYFSRLRDLVIKLMAYSLSQNPRENLNIESLNISEVIEELIGRFAPLLSSKKISIRQVLAEGMVKADRVALGAALGAVLENAIRFSPAHSEITITGKKDTKGQYRLEILDNGPGFEDTSKAFTFSRQAICPDADGIKSVGLGLVTAQSWLKEIGATIFVSTNKQQGAGVTIALPSLS